MNRPYPKLTPTDLDRLAANVTRLNALLTGDRGQRIQQTIRDAATIGMPTRASGSPGQPHNAVDTDDRGNTITVQPNTAVESAALSPDRAALQAARDLAVLARIAETVDGWLQALEGYDPERAVALCPRCGNPSRGARCDTIVDGVRCGASAEVQTCKNIHGCDNVLVPGDNAKGRCGTCRKFRERNKRDRIPSKALDLGADVIVTDSGAAHV